MRQLLYIALSLMIAGCGSTAVEIPDAQRDAAATQLAILAGTATAETALLRTTLEYVETRSSLSATRGAFLELTLVARGTPAQVLRDFQQSILPTLQPPTPTPPPVSAPDSNDPNNPPALEIIVTPLVLPTATVPVAPVVDPSAPRIEEVVAAPGVGADDCAINAASEFTTLSTSIYVVGRAINITRGTQLSSQWTVNGQQIVSYDFTPNFDIANACIWFFITPQEVAFTPGTWTVQLAINGTASGSPAIFTLRDASGG